MKCWVQILTTPTADTPGTTLLLHFDNKRYLIGNVAEGTQRAAVQRKVGFLKMKDIFLTGAVNWASTGGILGMILTVADVFSTSREETRKATEETRRKKGLDPMTAEEVKAGKVWLNIHGGKNLNHLLATARRFIFRKGTPLKTTEFTVKEDVQRSGEEPSWQDDNLRVWTMVLEPKGQAGRKSPRKRSHGEFSGTDMARDARETSEEREERYGGMREAVVNSMFDSTWKLDNLVKTKLSQVRKPAAIFIRNDKGHIEKYTGPSIEEDPSVGDTEVLVRNPWPGALIESLPPTAPSATSVCYILKNHPQRGRFDPKAAAALKVKKGPDYRRLTSGESVIAEDGATITPEMVLGKGKEGGGFAVVELPDSSYVEALITRKEWTSKEIMNEVGVIVWILGEGVLADPQLQQFMREHSTLKHIVSSPDCSANYLALESPAAAAIRLHLLDSERFPIPKFSNELPDVVVSENNLPYIAARSGHQIMLEPNVEVRDDLIIPYLDTKKVVEEASKEVLELAEIARQQLASPEYQKELEENQRDIPSKDAEVITLGTGSALPSKYRNVSATLLRVPGFGSYLIDCGENTLGQLRRVFGNDLPEVLRDLKAIWISHLHADHHLGTASIIREWAEQTKKDPQLNENRLIVASDQAMLQWLKEYAEIEDYGHERVLPIHMGKSGTYHHHFDSAATSAYGLTSIQACDVQHCNNALAVVLAFPNGFKVAYSGDCRPCPYFAKIGRGATLLIHEATFDDELRGDALAKKHSTTSEALDIARQMQARRILLTHFSQRYQKIPIMDTKGGRDQVAIVAFDYMRVKIGDFAKLDAFKPALMKLYEEENE